MPLVYRPAREQDLERAQELAPNCAKSSRFLCHIQNSQLSAADIFGRRLTPRVVDEGTIDNEVIAAAPDKVGHRLLLCRGRHDTAETTGAGTDCEVASKFQ
jgi:hypothetical protein